MPNVKTIADYLIDNLYNEGVRHVFGIPGDFVLGFYKRLEESKLKLINTCDEQGAGFAADAYARIKGLGVVCITYCVGGLKVANTTAQAYAEKSPVIIISGSPGMGEREKNPLLHHKVKDFDTQKKIFNELTVASTVLTDPDTAFDEIDRVINASKVHKRPVYIEIPRDKTFLTGISHHKVKIHKKEIDPEILKEAMNEVIQMINNAKKPVIIAGVEIHRYGLQDTLLEIIQKTGIPVVATLLGKSVISELHPLYLGVYEGAAGRKDVLQYVESSDCIILLGAFLTDVNLGIFTAKLNQKVTICSSYEKLVVKYHNYENLDLSTFMNTLKKAKIKYHTANDLPHKDTVNEFVPVKGKKLTVKGIFEKINSFLSDDTIVIADIGDSLFGAHDLCIHSKTEFLSPAYYTSLGFSIPASIGAQLANPSLRPLVIVGDGAFQMTGTELTTSVRYNLNPIVVILNNRGYGTERPMQDGSFNDIYAWKYSKIPELLGKGQGFSVTTEEEFDTALEKARSYTESFTIIDGVIDPYDFSPALKRLTEAMAERIKNRA